MDASAETGTGPLEGIRVLDLSIGQMGPAATALLADFGADVIKIESRHGDPGRGVELQPDGRSAFFLTHNRGKKSIALNLRDRLRAPGAAGAPAGDGHGGPGRRRADDGQRRP